MQPTWYTYTFNMAPSVGGSRNAAGQDTSTGLSNIDSCGDVGGTLATTTATTRPAGDVV